MTNRVRKSNRLNWDLIIALYHYKYTTQDIAALLGTSDGSVGRGLRDRVSLRPSGVPSMPVSPTQFDAETNKMLKEDGLTQYIKDYYNNVSVLYKASYVYDLLYKGKKQTEISQILGVSEAQVSRLVTQANQYLAKYEQQFQVLTNQKELLKVKARRLKKDAFRNRTQAEFAIKLNKRLA